MVDVALRGSLRGRSMPRTDTRTRQEEVGDPATSASSRTFLMLTLLLSADGVLIVSLAYAAARSGQAWAPVAYWVGHLLTFIPLASYVLSPKTPSKWVAIVGVALSQSLTTWMYSPLMFKFPDELQHQRTALDIVQYHSLFRANLALPVSPRFPGLEEITTCLMALTRLNLFTAGQIVAGLAHITLVAGILILMRRVARDDWVAAVAALIFAISPQDEFFNALWIYEVPALTLMALALIGATRRGSVASTLTAILGLAAVTVTHHVTAAITALTLLALGAGMVLQGGPRADRSVERADGLRLLALGAIGAVFAATWLIFVAPITYQYLGGPVGNVIAGFLNAGSVSGKAPVGGVGESALTLGATAVGTGAMAILVLAGVRVACRRGVDALTRTFAVLGLAFFGLLGVRFLSADGAELLGRLLTYEYLFVCVAAALSLTQLRGRRPRLTATLGLVAVALIFVGNSTSGWPAPYEFVPGPFKVDAFESGVTPAGVQAARWIGKHVPPRATVACDHTMCSLVGGYGPQRALDNWPALYYATRMDARTWREISLAGVDYVVVDMRLSAQRPVTGYYFEHESPGELAATPFPLGPLEKFNGAVGLDRVFDNGDIVIYRVRRADRG